MMGRATFIEKLIEVQQTVEQVLAQLQASEGDKVRGAPLSGSQAVSTSLRTSQQGEPGHRPRGYLQLPNRPEPGLQGGLLRLGALAADTRVMPSASAGRG